MASRTYYRNGRRVTRNVSIKFRGREVQNPVMRAVLGFVLAIIWLVMILLLLALSPVLILLHLALRFGGRKGFVYRSAGKLSIKVGIDGFRKAHYRYY